MTWAPLLALLWALTTLTAVRCWHRPSLRRAALALVILALADSARFALAGPQDGPLLRLDVALSLLWPTVAAWLIAAPWDALWLAYAVALALWGRHLAPWWGWALRAPRVAVGVLATVMTVRWLRRAPEPGWTTSQRIGLWLAVGQVAAVLAPGMWAQWDQVRIASAGVYLVIGWVVWREPR